MAVKSLQTPLGSFRIGYALEGDPQGAKVLFLHGWGASRHLMRQAFGPHCAAVHALYLDLPGFGGSSEPKQAMDSGEYTEVVRLFLEAAGFVPDVIVGHSFGGKIATRLDPPLLVLLSSAGIPKPKSLSVRLKIALAKWLRPLKSQTIRRLLMTQDAHGQSEVMYATLKRVVDEAYHPYFQAREKETLIFWGREDEATPLFCGEIIHRLIKKSRWQVLKGDHFFFMQHGEAIMAAVTAALEERS